MFRLLSLSVLATFSLSALAEPVPDQDNSLDLQEQVSNKKSKTKATRAPPRAAPAKPAATRQPSAARNSARQNTAPPMARQSSPRPRPVANARVEDVPFTGKRPTPRTSSTRTPHRVDTRPSPEVLSRSSNPLSKKPRPVVASQDRGTSTRASTPNVTASARRSDLTHSSSSRSNHSGDRSASQRAENERRQQQSQAANRAAESRQQATERERNRREAEASQRAAESRHAANRAAESRRQATERERNRREAEASQRAAESRRQAANRAAESRRQAAERERNRREAEASQRAAESRRRAAERERYRREAEANRNAARHRHGSAHHARHQRPHYSYSAQRPVHWYHGVFVYGPNPRHHHTHTVHQTEIVTRPNVQAETAPAPLPKRKLDRSSSFSVGLRTGTYMSGYEGGGDFSDFGVGVNARFRPVEGLGFEMAYTFHDDTFDSNSERSTSTLQPSVQAFAFPWARVSPYASVGLTWTDRYYSDTWSDGMNEQLTEVQDRSFGPHVGGGLEVSLGTNASIDLELRGIGYLNSQEADTLPGATQATLGANFYF